MLASVTFLDSGYSQSGNPLANPVEQLGVLGSIFMELHQILKSLEGLIFALCQ
jgi:hypothetical protein